MLEIDKETNEVIIFGERYPPTRHNLNVWQEYLETENKEVLKRLSKVVLE